MKKILAIFLAAVLTLSLAACGGTPASSASSEAASTGSEAASGEAAPASDLRVDVFYYNYADVYISSVRASMDEQLAALGIEPENWDAAGSQPTQTDQVNTAITAGSGLPIVNIVETFTCDAA